MDSTCVKNSLKSKILQRRQDIVVDFTPKPSMPMNLYEIEKDTRRKESNKRSARKSRLKQRVVDENNQQLLDKEYDKRNGMVDKIKKLENLKHEQLEKLRRLGISETLIQEHLQKTSVTLQRNISTTAAIPSAANFTHSKLTSAGLRANASGYDQSSGASTPSYSHGSRTSSPSFESVAQPTYRAGAQNISTSPYSSLESTDTGDSFRHVYTGFSSGSPSLVSDSCDEDRCDFNLDRSGDEGHENILPSFTNNDIMMTLAQSLTGYKDYDELEMKDD